jgi:ribosomal protein L12E/L44/L45/RPP1/RPP2
MSCSLVLPSPFYVHGASANRRTIACWHKTAVISCSPSENKRKEKKKKRKRKEKEKKKKERKEEKKREREL